MKYKLCIAMIILSLILGVFIIYSMKSNQSKGSDDVVYRTISPSEGRELLKKDQSVILLDVRTYEEYIEKHIPQSMLITLDVLEDMVESKIPDKNSTVLIYCRSGVRSKAASELLLRLGYKNVFDLGGIISWPYETESGE